MLTAGLFLGLTAAAHAASGGRVSFRYEGRLSLSQRGSGMLRPVAVTVNPASGELVVTDAREMGIHIFNPARIEVFRTNRFAGVVGPLDACLDADERIVYLQRVGGRWHELRRLDLYGEPDAYRAEVPAEAYDPHHLIVTRDGHYLSLDTDRGVVVKNDSGTGAILWTALLAVDPETLTEDAEDDSGLLLLGRPAEGPDGRIAIPGGETRRTIIIDADGAYLTSFGRFGTSPGRVVFPVAAAWAPDGSLLVLDRMRHKVLVYAGDDYSFRTEFGAQGAGAGQFYHPVAMASTADGRLLVAQGFQGRVQVFNILTDGDH